MKLHSTTAISVCTCPQLPFAKEFMDIFNAFGSKRIVHNFFLLSHILYWFIFVCCIFMPVCEGYRRCKKSSTEAKRMLYEVLSAQESTSSCIRWSPQPDERERSWKKETEKTFCWGNTLIMEHKVVLLFFFFYWPLNGGRANASPPTPACDVFEAERRPWPGKRIRLIV